MPAQRRDSEPGEGLLIFENVVLPFSNPIPKNTQLAGCLIQQRDEVAVFQNVLDLRGRKKVLHILGGTCGHAAPFAEALPNLGTVRGGLFFFQE